MASLIELETLQPRKPSSERIEFFESSTGMPYTPPSVNHSDVVTIRCPYCVAPTPHHVPWWDSEGTGYAQPGFKVTCSKCERAFNKEAMGVRRFCDEMSLRRTGSKLSFSYIMFLQHAFGSLMGF
jgi:hypothetical protein